MFQKLEVILLTREFNSELTTIYNFFSAGCRTCMELNEKMKSLALLGYQLDKQLGVPDAY